jgi:hypothetical protein
MVEDGYAMAYAGPSDWEDYGPLEAPEGRCSRFARSSEEHSAKSEG